MPQSVEFAISCSAADIARLLAARELYEALVEGRGPNALPEQLVGRIESVAVFSELFYEWPAYVPAIDVVGSTVYFEESDAEVEWIADLITICCADSLPVVFSWQGHGGALSGTCAVFEHADYWMNQYAVEQHLLERGRREAAERTGAPQG